VDLSSWVSIAFVDEKAEKSQQVEVSHAPLEVELAVLSKYSRSALEVCFEVADWLLEWLAGRFFPFGSGSTCNESFVAC